MSLNRLQLPGHQPQLDLLSVPGSTKSKAPSNLDKDLIVKFDDKRKAKY